MKYIQLSNLKIGTMVDDEDYDKFSHMKWRQSPQGYVQSTQWVQGKGVTYTLHRLIMGSPRGFDIDHIDHNRLNNQKSNLRKATRSENMMNLSKNPRLKKGHSQYKGVSKYNRPKLAKQWVANIKKDDYTYSLGYFLTEEDAAIAYDCAAIQLFGDFASLNILFK